MSNAGLTPLTCPTALQGWSPVADLTNAIHDFKSVLSDGRRREFENISNGRADTVLDFIAILDQENQKRKGRCISGRVYKVLDSVHMFSTIVDTFVSSNPEIAALVWGAIKITMLVAINYQSYFEALSGIFMQFGKHCPRYDEYRTLFPDSIELQKAVCNFHAGLVKCCRHAVEAAQRSRRVTLLHSFFQSFQKEFQPDLELIRQLEKNVKEAIFLAKAQADARYQKLQAQHTSEMENRWRGIIGFTTKHDSHLQEIPNLHIDRRRYNDIAETRRLLDFMSTHDYMTPFREACAKQHPKTAEWLCQTQAFTQWFDASGPRLFWCSGIIGSGKTVLCAKTIKTVYCNKSKDDVVTFFFVTPNHDGSLKAETIIRSIIRQSISCVALSDEMQTKLRNLEERPYTDAYDWIALLQSNIEASAIFYIFLDGLDECDAVERRTILGVLATIPQQNLKLFFSSRESLRVDLQRTFPDRKAIQIIPSCLEADIYAYLEASVQKAIDDEDLFVSDAEESKHIIATISKQANGMFLLVDFLLREVCIASYEGNIDEALNVLPSNVEDAYARALSRIISRQRMAVFAQKTFQWMAVARRPLLIEELHEAISIAIGQTRSCERVPRRISRLVMWCENMVHLNEESDSVHFAHSTVREYLLSSKLPLDLQAFHIDLEEAEHRVGELCVTYLELDDFKTALTRPPKFPVMDASSIINTIIRSTASTANMTLQDLLLDKIETHFNFAAALMRIDSKTTDKVKAWNHTFDSSHQFLRYSREYWIEHTKDFDPKKSSTWENWQIMVSGLHPLADVPWKRGEPTDENLASIVWAYGARHYVLMRHQFRLAEENKVTIRIPASLLLASVEDKELEAFELFLSRGSYTTLQLSHALWWAAKSGEATCVRSLIETGADIDIVLHGTSALMEAAELGHQDVVRLLLDAGAQLSGPSYVEQRSRAYPETGWRAPVNNDQQPEASVIQVWVPLASKMAWSSGQQLFLDHHQWLSILTWRDLIDGTIPDHIYVVASGLSNKSSNMEQDASSTASGIRSSIITPLRQALVNGHTETARLLMEAGAQVEELDEELWFKIFPND